VSPSLQLVPLLLAPNLTVISLGTFKSIHQLTILPALATRCPALTHIKLTQSKISQTDQSQTISAFVRGLEYIQALEIDHLGQDGFQHLAYLADLKFLTVGMPGITQADFVSDWNLEPTFAFLQELRLNSAPSQSVLAFIRTLSNSPLATFHVDITPPLTASSTRHIYMSVTMYLPRVTLENLRITSTRTTAAQQSFPIETPAITVDTIRLLFHFHNITSLALWPPTGIDVNDEAVLSMAEAFPRLAYLSLSSRAKAHPPRPTLRSLIFLAQRCPFLEHLEMGLNASEVPNLDYSLHKRVIQHNLILWDVADSLIKSPLLVARFLSGIFPELIEISTAMQDKWVYDDGVADVLRALWEEVEEALPICRQMRDEERYWMEQDEDSESEDDSVEL
jgi:hypothetical protein